MSQVQLRVSRYTVQLRLQETTLEKHFKHLCKAAKGQHENRFVRQLSGVAKGSSMGPKGIPAKGKGQNSLKVKNLENLNDDSQGGLSPKFSETIGAKSVLENRAVLGLIGAFPGPFRD